MQSYLPLLSEWYQFTLSNALYAGALATSVWLLTTILYSIKIAGLKKAKNAAEQTGIENVNEAKQQLQISHEQLATTIEQLDKANHTAQNETQRALALEQLIYQRNQQIAGIIQTLAMSFDLGERPILASEDAKAESLWQQHDKVINQLISRLRQEQQTKLELQQSCQANTAKLAEKETLIAALQTTLADHSNQLSKIELALEEQKTLLQQQYSAPAPQSFFEASEQQPDEPLPEQNTATRWQQSEEQEQNLSIEQTFTEHDHQADLVIEEPPAEPVRQYFVSEPEQTDTPADSAAEPSEPSAEQQPATPSKGSFGKIKNLFGKSKQQAIKTEPQWAEEQPEEPQPLPSAAEPQTDDQDPENTESKPGKLKNFYSKFRSKGK